MNSAETEYYSICADSQLLEFVGYRNELSMLSMTLALLKSRLHALKTVSFTVDESISEWQKFSLMYRSGKNIFQHVVYVT